MAEEIINKISELRESKHLYEDVCRIIDDTRNRVAETFTEEEIVSAVQRQFSWTHLKSIMYISDPLRWRNTTLNYRTRKYWRRSCNGQSL